MLAAAEPAVIPALVKPTAAKAAGATATAPTPIIIAPPTIAHGDHYNLKLKKDKFFV